MGCANRGASSCPASGQCCCFIFSYCSNRALRRPQRRGGGSSHFLVDSDFLLEGFSCAAGNGARQPGFASAHFDESTKYGPSFSESWSGSCTSIFVPFPTPLFILAPAEYGSSA